MRYPRKIMKTTELMNECGFTYRYLMKMAHIPDQKYAGIRKSLSGRRKGMPQGNRRGYG